MQWGIFGKWEDFERAWFYSRILESFEGKHLAASGGIFEQEELLMRNVLAIQEAKAEFESHKKHNKETQMSNRDG